jgi:hypothetical protein
MRDIVATIQAEQDEIIRLDHPEVLVIEGGRLPNAVVTLEVDAWAWLGGRLVVVLLAGLLFLWGDVGLGEHLEGMAGRHQPDRVVVLRGCLALGGGRFLDGQLGQWVGLQPFVGDWLAAAD